MTNIFVLSLGLVTNQQQAVVGQSNGMALLVTQQTVARQVELGYRVRGHIESLGNFSKVLSTHLSTNAVPIVMPAPPTSIPIPSVTNAPVALHSSTNATVNTNSPAYRNRLLREQRLKSQTNAPPNQSK